MLMKKIVNYVVIFLILGAVSMLAFVSSPEADTIAWPVSLVTPSLPVVSGQMAANTVSLISSAAPSISGQIDSRTVSMLSSPSSLAVSGTVDSKQVSILPLAPPPLDSSYIGKPVSIAYQSEKTGDPDLVGKWHMDGDWSDASGNGNHGTPLNGVTFSSDKKGGTNSGSFDGLNDNVPTADFRLGSNNFTITTWAKPASFTGINDPNSIRIFSKNNYPSIWWVVDLVKAGSDTEARISFSSHLFGKSSNGVIKLNEWSHFAIVIDRNNFKVKFYINGILSNEAAIPANVVGSLDVAGTNFTISEKTWNPYKGLIDETAIYKRALTADEIVQHYAAGITGDPNAPAAPVLNTVPAFIGANSITLSGTKPANTSIWVNNKKIVASDASTAWSANYATLQLGVNILNVTSLDEIKLLQSQTVSKTVFYDNIPPVMESSTPANNSNTAKVVTAVSINLNDTNAGVDLNASIIGATVKNSAGQTISGAWSTVAPKTIIFTPSAAFASDTYTVTIQATDLVSNKQQQQIVFTNHDTSAPVTTVTLSGTKDSSGWYSTPVTVTLTADDTIDGSGIAKVEYSLDRGTTWQTYTSSFVLDQDGKTTLQFRATDKNNIVEAVKTEDVKINKSGLVGWWKMDGDWKDSSLMGNNGTPYNMTFSSMGTVGTNSGNFNGTNGYVSIADSPSVRFANDFTASFWMYKKSQASDWQRIVGKGNSASRDYGIWQEGGSGKRLLFQQYANNTSGLGVISNTNIETNLWYHVAAVVKGNTGYIYINGVLDAQGARTTDAPITNEPLTFGFANFYTYFPGYLDDVRIYNRALSATEVTEQFRNISIGVPTVDPVNSPVNTPTITISGSKPANSSVVISNGSTSVELAPQTDAGAWAATTWSGQYTLSPGMNNLNITSKDVDGYHSQPANVSVVLDVSAPTVASSNPINFAIFKVPVPTITFNLTDLYSPLDLAATINEATVKNSSNLDISGTWTSSGNEATIGSATFTADMPMGEGTYFATITPTDSFGNHAAATVSFTVDMTAPTAPEIDPVPSPSNTTGKTITGSKSSDSSRVVVSCPGVTVGVISYPTATTWSVPVSGLREGINTLTAYGVDSAGNQSLPASTSLTIDLTAPAKPGIDAPSTPTNKTSITLTGSKEASSWLYVNNSKISAPLGDTTWSYAVPLSEGSNTITVFAKDEAGNQSLSASVTVVRDTSAPTIAASTPTTNAISGTVGSISITLTGGSGAPDLAASTVGAVVKNAAGTVIPGSWNVSDQAIVFTPTATLPEGVCSVTIYPTDTLGNRGSATFSFTVDKGPPTVQTFTISPVSPLKAGTASFTLTFNENMNTAVQPQVTFGSASYSISGAWLDAKNWRGSYALTAALGDGSYSVLVKGARDIAGNSMIDQTAGSFLLDTAAPAVPSVVAVTPLTRTATQLLTGAKSADSAIVINDQVRVPLNSATSWSYSYPLREGSNTLTIIARDAAGNDSAAITPAPVITLDTTPPVFTVDVWITPAAAATQLVSGKKEPGCIVKLNGVQIFDATNQSADWSYTLTLVDGISNRFVFTATDAIGNNSGKTIDILFDSVPPTALGVGVLVATGSGKGTEVTLTWPSYPEQTALAYYRVYQSTADFTTISGLTPIGTVSKGTKTYKATGLTKGSNYFFAVVPVSSSGNSDPSVHTASAIPTDTVAPEDVTGLSAVAGYSAADGNTVTLYWTASANSISDQADQILYVDNGQGYDAGTPIGKTAVTYTKKGLADATLYKFKVTTKDALSHESAGTVITAVTRLANPSGLTVVPGNAKATLGWQPVASSYVKLYNLYRIKSDVAQSDISGMTLIKSQATTSFIDTGLSNDSVYQYAVTVINTSGAERTGVQSVAVTPRGDITGPVISGLNLAVNQVISAPFSITATASDTESALDRIELYLDSVKVATAAGNTLAFNWNTIDTSDGNHAVRIVAYDAPGNKSETTIQVVVSLAAPSAPVITSTFSGAITQNSVTISGTTQAGATVSLRINGVVIGQQIASGTNFTFTNVPLVEGDNYIAAKAANRGGESPFSADLKVTVDSGAPSAPTALTAKLLAAGAIQLSWQSGSGETPTGFNLYESLTPFTSVGAGGVHKTNSAAIAYLLKEQIPADDTLRYYAVTALDGAGNESPISNIVSIASDRFAPTATVAFSPTAGTAPSDNTYGPGQLNVSLTVSEPLKEMPFLSLEPQSGSPIVVALQKTDDTHYTATLTIDATSPHGSTVWKFSGKDNAANRGNSQGTGPFLDVRGPQAAITAPLTLLKSTAGPVAVSVTLDEASTITPVMTLGSAPITSLTTSDNTHWSGTLDPSGLAEGTARFTMTDSRDRFGNRGSNVSSGAAIIIYKTTPPAPSIPMGLTAKSFKGGEVRLAWMPVTDARSYNIYRQGSGDASPLKVATLTGSATTTYSEFVATDGSYAYSISSVGLLDAESAQSAPVSVIAAATPPPVPSTITLAMTGNGVKAEWQAGAGEATPFFRLYRSTAPISNITGLSPVATVNVLTAFDPSPDPSKRFYAVTSLDAIGNESAPGSAPEITFPVMPVRNLVVSRIDDGKPALSWEAGEANLQGFYLYRNGSRVNQVPTLSTSFSDGNYGGGSVTYGVSSVNSLGTESPVREATLPELTIGLKEGTVLRRGVLENIVLTTSLPQGATTPLTLDAVALKIGNLPESTENGPFNIQPGTPLEISKVAATEANAPPQTAVVTTVVMTPIPGVTVKLIRSVLAGVIASGSPLEIFNEPLIRGTQGKARIKVTNTGSARMEFVSSTNGGASSQARVILRDQDNNILAQSGLTQRAGSQVVDSGSYATVRLEPGESFLSDPVTFTVPANAPYKVALEAVIDNTYYHYGQPDQVTAPGLKQGLDATIADVSYMASAVTDKMVYKQGESILISGTAISSANGSLMANVPVKVGVSVKGFDRFATVNTNSSGSFSYTFTPGSNEAGSYSVWAIHPDLSDRTVQAQFSIIGLQISPLQATIRLLKGQYFDIPVNLVNLGGSPLTNLSFATNSSSGITATPVNTGTPILNPGENRTIIFRVGAEQSAPASGYASLNIGTAEGLGNRVDASITTISAIPVIATTPSFIDTGLMRGNQRIENLTIRNTGAETLINPSIEGPSLPWLALTVDKNIGDIPAGQSRTIGILIKPADTLAQGTYNDRLVIYSDNHIPYNYNIQVTVTSSAVGNVQFSVINELLKDVIGANITLQHQSLPELYYTLRTATDGTAALFDIPEGRYTFNISAAGHKPYSGSVVIVPGITAMVPIALEVTLVTVEWSVTPVTITDSYQITVSQTFETNVPTSVIVTEPPAIQLPNLAPGQVYNGEFTITNYGLVSADYGGIDFPSNFEEYDLEVLARMPTSIGANQKIVVPYRITRRVTTAAATANIGDEITGYGGGACSGSRNISVSFSQIICPYSLNERKVTRTASHTISWNTCPITSGGIGGIGGGGTSPTSTYGGTGTGTSSGQTGGGGSVPGGSGASTSLPDPEEKCILPCRPNNPDPTCPSGSL